MRRRSTDVDLSEPVVDHGGAVLQGERAARFLIWKDLSIASWLVDSNSVSLFDVNLVALTPGSLSHPGVRARGQESDLDRREQSVNNLLPNTG